MRIVYWGCWADATGEQGPFSATLATKFVGFDAPTLFLVGYGLDHAENFRHLPYIASLT
jgi:hypoxanthine-guanine phosphoribosyltransferase